MEEIWKDVVGYEGLYQVSNLGNVRNTNTRKHKKQMLNKYGYYRLVLWKNNTGKNFVVHRLVAEAFIPNPNNFPYINHKDECKTNNNILNLEYCTPKYNSNYGTGSKRQGKKKEIPVKQYDMNGNYIQTFPSGKIAGETLGLNRSKISNCCKGKRQSTGNYKWKYAKEG